ncbi:sensor histidine kinase [Pengzhenrongella sicca]|uniref:histidine kinase n=1 Tax=Pengzhenrongella sicca TaxID=2819238 RepID=A0A8A4ZB20_9MICO|nr:HAMP domain-containing sensor histidine kinase [Pengzhenrongella sicca]QTE29102.1 HAMP domain-containing histidine kinase [Pengzhenrongella sicca]
MRGRAVRGLAWCRGRQRRMTVRVRVLAAVLALAALAMAIAGATSTVVQTRRTDARIDDSLGRAAQDLRDFARTDLDPATGEPFADLADLLYLAVQRRAPAANEGALALVDGRETWLAARTVSLRLEDDPELMAVLRTLDPATAPRLRTQSTATTQYRFVALPVSVSGDPAQGFFVVAVDRSAEHRALMDSLRGSLVVSLGSLLIIGAVGWLVVGGLLRPVRLLRDTAQRITETDLTERIAVTGRDDLSDLARTVNAMLDRLQRAVESQRDLLDDVGHELRTPLTIVRGHLELMDPANPADARATQSLALAELDRMHRLVDDLATLAIVDRPDFVRPRPTDLGQLTDDVLDNARLLGDRRWQVEARADAVVVVDAQRITQAWLQLIANAVRYSPAGSRVRVGSAVTHGRVLIWVHDDGAGVAAQDAGRIFQRFERGAQTRAAQRANGAGLGLPIVAAIAAAHDGSVRLERARTDQPPTAPAAPREPDAWGPLAGARFVLDLPAVEIPRDDDPVELDLDAPGRPAPDRRPGVEQSVPR